MQCPSLLEENKEHCGLKAIVMTWGDKIVDFKEGMLEGEATPPLSAATWKPAPLAAPHPAALKGKGSLAYIRKTCVILVFSS